MNVKQAKEVIQRQRVVPGGRDRIGNIYDKEVFGVDVGRVTFDGKNEDGDFPSNELAGHPDVDVLATDDAGNPVPILRWENNAPVAPGASWVFYYDTQE